jgi:2-polyprenyl-3-methyl-5-hydroxy-6-metoxy-1,4-benzoquinol methylase
VKAHKGVVRNPFSGVWQRSRDMDVNDVLAAQAAAATG